MHKSDKKWFYIIGILLVIAISIMILYTVKETLLPYDPKIDDLKESLALVHPESRNLSFYHDKKSYTINKQNNYQ